MNPLIGLLPKVIPLKLFLDIVPSSSTDITRAMRGRPKRLSRSYRRRNPGNVIVYVMISFHSRDVLCALSRLFVLCSFGCSLFCRLFVFGSLTKQSAINSNEYNGCVSLRHYTLNVWSRGKQLVLFSRGTIH